VNWLDVVLVLIFGLSLLEGLIRGFARVGVGFAAAVFGLFFAIWFYGPAGAFLQPYVSHKGIANFIGFFLVFIGFLVVGGLVGRLLALLFRWAGLTWLDRLLGGLFGALRGLIAAIAVVLALSAFAPKPPPRAVAHSRLAPYVIEAASICSDFAPKELKDGFYSSYEKIKQLWSEALQKKPLPRQEI